VVAFVPKVTGISTMLIDDLPATPPECRLLFPAQILVSVNRHDRPSADPIGHGLGLTDFLYQIAPSILDDRGHFPARVRSIHGGNGIVEV
jgi:hypothetical protein